MSWYFFVLRHGDRVVLVDTGTDRLVSRTALRRRWSITQAEPVLASLRRAGIDHASITDVLLTHSHWDHIGGLQHFPGARVHMSRLTYRALPHRVRRSLSRDRVHLFGDEHTPFDGLSMRRVGSHTRGHSIVAVSCEQGPRVIAGDVAYLRQNFEQLRPITQSTGASINRRVLRTLMESYAIDELIPGHDPSIFGEAAAEGALRTAVLCRAQ